MSERAAITIRMDASLLQALREHAAKRGHSINAEIVDVLSSGRPVSDGCRDFLREEATELEAQIPGIKWELDEAHKRLGEMITTLAETGNPVTNDKIALLQTQTQFYRAKLDEAESRLRRIRRVIK